MTFWPARYPSLPASHSRGCCPGEAVLGYGFEWRKFAGPVPNRFCPGIVAVLSELGGFEEGLVSLFGSPPGLDMTRNRCPVAVPSPTLNRLEAFRRRSVA